MKRKHGKKAKTKAKKKPARKSGGDISKELGELGRKVEKALKAAASSKHLGGVKSEITKSVRNVGKKLTDALTALQESEDSRELQRQVKKVFKTGKKQGSETSRKLASDISQGLDTLAKELERLAGKLGKK